MSMSRPASFTRMRPSCGSRFSAMFSPPMIFTREMMEFWNRLGGRITSCSTPSTRKRTQMSFSCGSMWMSLARSLAARKRGGLTRRMLGEVDRDLRDQLLRDFLGRDPHLIGQLELRRQRFEHLLLGASLERDQDFAQAAPALALRRQRLLQLLARDGAVREQDLADPQACEASAGGLARGRFCDAFHWTSTSWIRLLFRRRRLFRRRLFGLRRRLLLLLGHLYARRGLLLRLGWKGGRRRRRGGESALVQLGWSITLAGPDHPLIGTARTAVLVPVKLLLHTPSHAREGARLAVVFDGGLVLRLLAIEPLHELRALSHLALEDAPVVALIADDVRGEEQQEIRLRLLGGLAAEEPAEDRQRSEHRHLLHVAQVPLLDQAAEDDGLLILRHHGGLGGALGGGGPELLVDAGDLLGLLVHVEPDVIALVDLRLDAQAQLDILPLDGSVEGPEAAQAQQRSLGGGGGGGGPRQRGEGGGARRVRGLEGDVLADGDLAFGVVGHDHGRSAGPVD